MPIPTPYLKVTGTAALVSAAWYHAAMDTDLCLTTKMPPTPFITGAKVPRKKSQPS